MKTIILQVADDEQLHMVHMYTRLALKKMFANAKEAIQVKFDIDKETGLSVIDANGKFHFEGQDKYYAVAVDK